MHKYQDRFHPAAGELAKNSHQDKAEEKSKVERDTGLLVRSHLCLKHEQKYHGLNITNI